MIGSRGSLARGLAGAITIAFIVSACQSSAPDDNPQPAGTIGKPVAAGPALHILHNEGFVIGYDERAAAPAWVAYQAKPISGYKSLPRPDFEPDPRVTRHDNRAAYAGPAYDRGHLAPNYAISQLYGARAQRQTFYYSNVAPQSPRLNQLVWQRLEEIEVDDIAPRVGTLWVFAGPIPAASGAAPSAFYRIWLAQSGADNAWQALAFVVPQTVRGDERLDAFRVSVDRIEALTGLDFMPGLSSAVQAEIESLAAPASQFGFAAFACQPARYGRRWQDRDGIHLLYDRCGTSP